jgi:hypothetical protein
VSNLPPPPEPTAPRVQKKRHYLLWGIVIVVAVIGIAELTTKSETPTTTVPGVGQGLGSQDASGDVSLGDCSTSYGVVTCDLTIVNHSDGISDYYIEAVAEDSTGANVGSGNGVADHVEAGQTAKADLTVILSAGAGKPSDITIRLTQVQRTASS